MQSATGERGAGLRPTLEWTGNGYKLVPPSRPDWLSQAEWDEVVPKMLASVGRRIEKRAAKKHRAIRPCPPEVRAIQRKIDKENPWGVLARWRRWMRRNLESYRTRRRWEMRCKRQSQRQPPTAR